MSSRMSEVLTRDLDKLRHEPTEKRIRASLDGQTVVDTVRAVLVWEPRRVVPSYAVPVADVRAALIPTGGSPTADSPTADSPTADAPGPTGEPTGVPMESVSRRPVLDPSVPFAVHTTAGRPVGVRAAGGGRTAEGFRPTDPDLADHVILDFAGFETWYEEDERIAGHPRDPFHRIDVLPSSREVRVELDGTVIARSTRAVLLFETLLPVRCYLPREDVLVPLRDSSTVTYCAYKGAASYWSAEVDGVVIPDLAWGYVDPLREAGPVRGKVAFFTERVDLVLDGEPRARPVTPWS